MFKKIALIFYVILLLAFIQRVKAEQQVITIGLTTAEILDDGEITISYNGNSFLSDFVITTEKGKILFPDKSLKPVKIETMEEVSLKWEKEGLLVYLNVSAEQVILRWEGREGVKIEFCVKDSAVNGKPIKTKDISQKIKEDILSFDRAFPDSDRTGLLSLEFFEEKNLLMGIVSESLPFSFKDYRKQKGYSNKWLISSENIKEKGEILFTFRKGTSAPFVRVDISKYCNMGFSDEVADDGKGGWSDDGPDNDLKNFPVGTRVFNNIPFNVIDPSTNNGRSCIVLKGGKDHGASFPELVSIPVSPVVAKAVYILHGTTWTPSSYQGPVAIYRFFYDDGSYDEFEIVNNRDVVDWWFAPQREKLQNYMLAWEGSSGERWVGIGISSFRLTKEKPVVKVEIQKAPVPEGIISVPGIIGITFSKMDLPVLPMAKGKMLPSSPPLSIFVYGAGNINAKLDEPLNLKGLTIEEFSGELSCNVVMIGKGLSKSWCTGIEEFVRNGGGLLIALPPEDTLTNFLKNILPVDITGGKTVNVDKNSLILPVVMDKNHPVISNIDWKSYPGSPVYYQVKEKDGASVLIRWSNGSPALVVWNVGKGRVGYFAAPMRTDFGQIYLASEFHDYRLFFLRLAYWLSGNDSYAETLGFLGKAQRLRDTLTDLLAKLRTSSEDLMQLATLSGDSGLQEGIIADLNSIYSMLAKSDKLLAGAMFKEASGSYEDTMAEIKALEEKHKNSYSKLKDLLIQKGFSPVAVKKGVPVEWGMHGILQYSNSEDTDNSAIREYTIGVYLDTISKLGMNTFVQGGGTNRFIKKGADPTTVDVDDLQLDIYDDYIRAAKKYGMKFFIHLDGRESIHDNFDGNYDYLHEGFIDKLPYPEKRGRAKGAESHPFDRYNEEALARYNKVLRLIASRYKDEPVVTGYNTDNETGNLYWQTEEASQKFRQYLVDKYKTLDGINKALGYNFSSITEISIPQESKVKDENKPSSPLKALWYEWKEFENWITFRYFSQYKDAIKSISPEKRLMDRFSPNNAIGHGTYNPYGDIPYDKITSLHDLTGLHIGREYNIDYMAGYAGNAKLGLSEYYPLVWGGPYNAAFRLLPGLGNQWAVPDMEGEIYNYAAYVRNFWLVFSRDVRVILDHAMGNGSDFLPDELSHSNPYGFGYFRYGVYGMKYVNAAYTEMRGEIDGAVPFLPVAIMEPNESRIQTISSPIAEDVEILPRESAAIYNTLTRPLFLNPDVIPTGKDISGYKVVIVPYGLYLKEETQKKLEDFVKNGGILMATGPIGIYNELSMPSGYILRQVWGINKVERMEISQGKIKFSDGFEMSISSLSNKRWVFEEPSNCDVKVIARYSDGKPAILESRVGKGRAFLMGWPFRSSSGPQLLEKTIIPFVPALFKCSQTELCIYPRQKGNDLILFVVNRLFNNQKITISLIKNTEIVDLRIGLGWKGDSISCNFLPGEGRVFKIKDYFPLY